MHRLYHVRLRWREGVEFGVIRLNGIPLIEARNGGRIVIGHNVLLNSINPGYHLNMFGPVKLLVDRPQSIIEIGANTRIHGSCIHAQKMVKIGENCLIAANCQIIDSNAHELSFPDVQNRLNTTDMPKPITIEQNVWLGASCFVLPGIVIGRGSVIGAGSVVTKEIPPMCVAAGNPARVIRCYKSQSR